MSDKPLLLLDVDGPLNPYAAKATRRPEGYETHRYDWSGLNLRVWLNPEHGAKLLDLGYELVWATMWENEANSFIGPKIGLPELPFIDFRNNGRVIVGGSNVYLGELYVKTPRISYVMKKYHYGRPFIWVDDEATPQDEQFLRETTDSEVKVFTIDPKIGLTNEDFDEMKAWKEQLDGIRGQDLRI